MVKSDSDLSTTRPLEGCCLHDFIRGLSVEKYAGMPSFFPLLSLLQKLEIKVSQALEHCQLFQHLGSNSE